jgi:hypothetical protein
MTSLAIADLRVYASVLARAASALLFGLAHGEHGKEVEITERFLDGLGVVFPPAAEVEKSLEIFLLINTLTAPSEVVPDGRGGFVPSTNSKYDPETGKFL